MSNEFKQEIRQRAGTGSQYIYRGNEIEDLVAEVRSGVVSGGEHDIYTGELLAPVQDPVGMAVEDLPWDTMKDDLSVEKVPITGGFSSSLAQTHRFNGSENTTVVLEADSLPVHQVEYTYDFYNDHPGVYSHVRSSVEGELRETQYRGSGEFGKLVGFVKEKFFASGNSEMQVGGYSVDGDLPGTSSNSLIAQEAELVAYQPQVAISSAVDSFVTVIEPLSARVAYARGRDMVPGDAPPADEILEVAFERYADPVPSGYDHYLILVEDFQDYQTTSYEGWEPSEIISAIKNGARVDPQNVPNRVRGEP